MGLFNSKSKQTVDMTTTSTPNVPDWLQNPIADAYGRVRELGGVDPRSLVAPLSDLQRQAGAGAAGLGRSSLFGEAADMTRSLLGGAGPGGAASGQWGGVDKYMNPYISQVVDATMARNNQNREMGLEANRLRYSGGRGGSNEAVASALLGGQYDLNDQQTIGGLLSGGFDRASALADAQAARDNAVNMQNAQLGAQMFGQRLAGAGQIADIGAAEGADARANVGAQADIGSVFQENDLLNRTAPLNLAEWQIDQYGRLVPSGSLSVGNTATEKGTTITKNSPSIMQGVGQVVGTAASAAKLFSDARLKRDIVRLGERPDGLGVYLYRYVWSPILRVGVMAQEALRVKPQAVLRHPSGFLMVDYGKL